MLLVSFAFAVSAKQNTYEEVKHMNKQTIMGQNRQSILKDKTGKTHRRTLEVSIKTVPGFQNQRLFWVPFSFVSNISPLLLVGTFHVTPWPRAGFSGEPVRAEKLPPRRRNVQHYQDVSQEWYFMAFSPQNILLFTVYFVVVLWDLWCGPGAHYVTCCANTKQ